MTTFSGTVAIRAMKDNDYQATIFPGTYAGLQAAVNYCSTGGIVYIGPGTLSLTGTITGTTDRLTIQGSGMGVTILNYTGGGTAFNIDSTGLISKDQHFADFTIQIGANQAGVLFQYTGGDETGWTFKNVMAYNPANSGFTCGTAFKFLNCQNGNVTNLRVRSADPTKFWTYGIDIDLSDAIQRGNIVFTGGVVNNCTTGVAIARSVPANAINNCVFNGIKFVNTNVAGGAATQNGTTGISIGAQAFNTTLINPQFEVWNTAINCSGSGLQALGGLYSQVHNDANNSGDCILIAAADGALVSNPYFFSSYNGIRLTGVTKRVTYFGGNADGITGTEVTDSSSGTQGNHLLRGNTLLSVLNATARVKATAAFGFDSAGTGLVVAANAITATKAYHQVDNSGGAVTVNTISGLNDGDVLFLRPQSDANTTTFGSSGNLFLNGTTVLRSSSESITFLRVGTNFMEVARSLNSYGITTGKGIDITAAATIGIPTDGNVFHVTGNTNITNGITVNASDIGRLITLIFDGTPTVSDTGTSKLVAAFVATADDTLTLVCDGTNWYQVASSVN